MRNYTGTRYTTSMTATDIAKNVRQYCRAKHPQCKFSVTAKYFSGGSEIRVALMKAPFHVFEDAKVDYEQLDYIVTLRENNPINGRKLTRRAWEVLRDVVGYLMTYRYDYSNPQIDYFDTNFYISVAVGKWNKPFEYTGD